LDQQNGIRRRQAENRPSNKEDGEEAHDDESELEWEKLDREMMSID